jgi:hypothetical protein
VRYDLYRGAAFVASYHFPEGEQPTLHANKGRLLKYDPPGYDQATEKLVQTAVTEETADEIAFTVTALTSEEIDALHPRKMLSGWGACSLIMGQIGPERFVTMYSDPNLALLRIRIDTCKDVDPADMPGVKAMIQGANPTFLTDTEYDAIMASWPR